MSFIKVDPSTVVINREIGYEGQNRLLFQAVNILLYFYCKVATLTWGLMEIDLL